MKIAVLVLAFLLTALPPVFAEDRIMDDGEMAEDMGEGEYLGADGKPLIEMDEEDYLNDEGGIIHPMFREDRPDLSEELKSDMKEEGLLYEE